MLRCILNAARSPFWAKNSGDDLRSKITKLNGSVAVLRKLHTTTVLGRKEDRKMMYASLPAKDEGTFGEKLVAMDAVDKKESMFPDETTADRLFDGVPFKELPICNVKVSPNNTIFTVTDYKGTVKLLHTAGIEGFKNSKKGTNIAAQTAALTISTLNRFRGRFKKAIKQSEFVYVVLVLGEWHR